MQIHSSITNRHGRNICRINKKVQIMQNESETEFHRVYKVSPTQQLTKLTHLLRESGDFLHGDKEGAYIVPV